MFGWKAEFSSTVLYISNYWKVADLHYFRTPFQSDFRRYQKKGFSTRPFLFERFRSRRVQNGVRFLSKWIWAGQGKYMAR